MSIEALLAHLPGDSPCGEDLGYDPAFDDILELRREDDATLAQGEWVRELKRADWPGVVSLGTSLLSQRTKDLRLAGWWLDASARVSGWQGLADGLDLVEGLCARWWSEVHPRDEAGDWELRIGSLAWLLGRVEAMAATAPFLSAGVERFGLAELRTARQRVSKADRVVERDKETAQEREVRERDERVLRALRALDRQALSAFDEQARRARRALGAIESIVDRELGSDGPAFGGARQALDEAVHDFERLHRDAGGASTMSSSMTTTTTTTTSAAAAQAASKATASLASSTPVGGPPATRAEALAQLREVAEFFRRTEPHSPVAYLADKAAQWGEMPLHTWLRSVLRDPSALGHLEELLGVQGRERE